MSKFESSKTSSVELKVVLSRTKHNEAYSLNVDKISTSRATDITKLLVFKNMVCRNLVSRKKGIEDL